MRLFLSSYRAGNHSEKLLGLLNGIDEVGIISNAKDYHEPLRRAQRMDEVYDFFKSVGVVLHEIDLRPYFSKGNSSEELSKHKFIWLAGGNIFLLRRALEYSGAVSYLTKTVKDASLILGGESAGAVVLGPTFRGFEMEGNADNPNFIPESYKSEVIWEGLGLVSYVPIPHCGGEDYGSEVSRIIKQFDRDKIPHKDMTDDQAIMVSGDKEEFLE